MASNIAVLRAKGLNTSPNELNREEGSLIEAENIVIRKDGVIEPIRGFKTWGTSLPGEETKNKQLLSYRNRILRHYSNYDESEQKLQYDNDGTGNFLNFNGVFNEVENGLRIKSIEDNGNLYFTTSEGIKKISAKTSDDFSEEANFITSAGGIKATDFKIQIMNELGQNAGFFVADSTLAYRIVWGTKDRNNNLILGTPSQIQILTNKLSNLVLADFVNILALLDSLGSSLINDKDYVSTLGLNSSNSTVELRTNLIKLCEKIDNDILISNTTTTPVKITNISLNNGNCTISFNQPISDYLSTGKKIKVTNLKVNGSTTEILNGNFPVTIDSTTNTATYSFATIVKAQKLDSFPIPGDEKTIYQAIDTNKTYVWEKTAYLETQFEDYYTVSYTTTDYVNKAAFPATGIEHIVYKALDTNKKYVWNGTAYIETPIIEINTVNYTLSAHDDVNSFDITGDSKKLYKANDTGKYYIWSNDVYIEVSQTLTTALDFSTMAINYAEYSSIEQPSEITSLPALNNELLAIQDYLNNIKILLVNEPNSIVNSGSDKESLLNFELTRSSKVKLTISIPDDITSDYFYQIYRSRMIKASGAVSIDDLTPSAEFQLVYEGFPTDLTSDIVVTDNTPEDFMGAYLYTNETTGEGDAQANEAPPLAKDINIFKGHIFYANTQTKQKFILSLLGVSEIIKDIENSLYPKLIIASKEGITNVYSFIKGIKQQSQVTINQTSANLDGKYFTLDSSYNSYFIWFRNNDGSLASEPSVSGKTGIRVDIEPTDTTTTIAQKLKNKLSTYVFDFESVTYSSNTVTIINPEYEELHPIQDGNTGCVFLCTLGVGESGTNVIVSEDSSAGKAVEKTAKSLIRAINRNTNEEVSAFYTSAVDSVPGKMILEARTLTSTEFYLATNTENMGLSFNPNLLPTKKATSISSGSFTSITYNNHNLIDGDKILISNSSSSPNIDGIHTIKRINSNVFSIDVNTIVSGNPPYFNKLSDVKKSENEKKPNRVYFSKRHQAEAVPLVNYIDLGAEEKDILRIFPLRNSLFIFKVDGLYRISGESSPFSSTLFDSSVNLLAPDSICLVDNLIYCWTTQGIQIISESGTQTISRPIDNIILKLASANYVNFKTVTWGIGYGSDSSIIMWTNLTEKATNAEIGFRYNTLTNSWTTITKSPTCGIIFDYDNVMYLGASDTPYTEQERKQFNRFDYAGREYNFILDDNKYSKNIIRLSNVENLKVGQSIVQEQKLTISEFNILLNKLDLDPSIADNDYYAVLKASAGQNLRSKIEQLANKMDEDVNLRGAVVADKIGFSALQINDAQIIGNVCMITFVGDNAQNHFSLETKISVNGFSPENGEFLNPITLDSIGIDYITFTTDATGTITLSNPSVSIKNYAKSIEIKTGIITSIGTGIKPIITCNKHGLISGRKISISGSNSVPSIDTEGLDKQYIVSVIDENTFTIDSNVKVSGSSGTFSTIINDVQDIYTCYNEIISMLNTDTGARFSDYPIITTDSLQEAVITKIDTTRKEIELDKALDFVVGYITAYEYIATSFTYSPVTFGDPITLKQVIQSTIMMDSRNISKMRLEFKTDLKPAFISVDFNLDGKGLIGHSDFGEELFGGKANAAPVRTIIPRDCQRCRYIVVRFSHNIAREVFYINGLSLTANVAQSVRAYR